MALEQLVTIGAYGFTEDGYFEALRTSNVDTLLDIRQRRGVRGKEYAFANRARLMKRLEAMDITYLHERRLAPTSEIRAAQYAIDDAAKVQKRKREALSAPFRDAYMRDILEPFDLPAMIASMSHEMRVLALFCVERKPEACHRHLVADEIARVTRVPVHHLAP